MRLCVFDSSWFIHYGARSARHKDYTFSQFPLGGVKFLTNSVLIELLAGNNVICCFDSATNKHDLYPGYKANRPRESYIFSQTDYAYSMFMKCGISCFKSLGHEADDLIASVVTKNRAEFNDIVCYTNDADISHNVTEGVRVLAACDGGIDITPRNFKSAAQRGDLVEYNTISAYKVLIGDSSDKIRQFRSSIGLNGRQIYNSYVLWGNESLPNDYRRSYLFSTRQILEFHLNTLGLSADDLEELGRRMDVVFPMILTEVPSSSIKDSLIVQNLSKLLTILNEDNFLRRFGLERQRLSSEEFTEFRNNAQVSQSIEYTVDRSLPVHDSFIEKDLGGSMNLRLF